MEIFGRTEGVNPTDPLFVGGRHDAVNVHPHLAASSVIGNCDNG